MEVLTLLSAQEMADEVRGDDFGFNPMCRGRIDKTPSERYYL